MASFATVTFCKGVLKLNRHAIDLWTVWLLGVVLGAPAMAQDSETGNDFWGSLPNLRVPTLGGKQFWTDHAWRQGWRIQHNAVTGHWRLLDEHNVRWAWGARDACQRELDARVPSNSIPADRVILLLHGLMRSANSMSSLGNYLHQELQVPVIYFEYASTRSSITSHAEALAEVIDGLPENVQIILVGHSMGNIVARRYLGDLATQREERLLNRIESFVMIGPPNQGSSIAKQLSKTGVFGWVTGAGGLELGPGWDDFEKQLAIPKCPFGIIAGRLPDNLPLNPLVDGQGDFVVSVEETKLPGAADFLEVPRIHSFLMDAPDVQAAVAQFIQTHQFE